jgi:hypothetical protein
LKKLLGARCKRARAFKIPMEVQSMKVAKRLFALLAALALVLALAGCKEAAVSLARKMLGTSSETEEADTTRWAEAAAEGITLPDGVDSTAKFTAERAGDGQLYVVFNGIWTRETGYFLAPNGSLTLTASGSAEGTQKYKIALWKRVDGGTEYVEGSTGYIHTDGGTYTYTVNGLDPAAQYRLTISYDSTRYYLYGMIRVDGIG